MRHFSRRNAIYAGAAVLIAVILAALVMQITFLRELEQSASAFGLLGLRTYLGTVARDIDAYYRTAADKLLTVPPDSLSQADYDGIADYFRKGKSEGVHLLFTVDFASNREPRQVFYAPRRDFARENPSPRERDAVMEAGLPWLNKFGAPIKTPLPVFDERDRDNPIILKPVVDSASRMVGIAGMILDSNFFAEHLLPRLVRENFQSFFPIEGERNIIVSLYDSEHRQTFATQSGQGSGEPMIRHWYFAFPTWYLTGEYRYLTPQQWAKRQFLLGLATTILMAIVLVGGVFFLVQSSFQAIKLSQMRTEFVSNVSHELRTPLSSIRVRAEFLRLGRIKDLDQVRQYGEYIESESQRLTHLIDTILDFSAIESGRKVYQLEKADASQLVTETIHAVLPELSQSGFTITREAPPEPLPPVMIDKDAIAEALINLLDNAAKYSTQHKELLVRLSQENGFIRIAVTDRGIGLLPEDRKRIFENFYRVSNGLVHDVRGNGLGLAITKHIVEAHGGKITVDSELGRGSTFALYLRTMTG